MTDTVERPTLTVSDVFALAKIVTASQHESRVGMARDGGEDPWTGTARHLVTSQTNWGFPSPASDIRDAYVRIAWRNGLDTAYPITQLVQWFHAEIFVVCE
jgi:hypothetical protein